MDYSGILCVDSKCQRSTIPGQPGEIQLRVASTFSFLGEVTHRDLCFVAQMHPHECNVGAERRLRFRVETFHCFLITQTPLLRRLQIVTQKTDVHNHSNNNNNKSTT